MQGAAKAVEYPYLKSSNEVATREEVWMIEFALLMKISLCYIVLRARSSA